MKLTTDELLFGPNFIKKHFNITIAHTHTHIYIHILITFQ